LSPGVKHLESQRNNSVYSVFISAQASHTTLAVTGYRVVLIY